MDVLALIEALNEGQTESSREFERDSFGQTPPAVTEQRPVNSGCCSIFDGFNQSSPSSNVQAPRWTAETLQDTKTQPQVPSQAERRSDEHHHTPPSFFAACAPPVALSNQ